MLRLLFVVTLVGLVSFSSAVLLSLIVMTTMVFLLTKRNRVRGLFEIKYKQVGAFEISSWY